MDNLKPLTDEQAFTEALGTPLFVLLKHSPICGVSAAAHREVQWFAAGEDAPPCYIVNVISDRGLSRKIADRTGVKHASPQVMVFVDGKPQWVRSHWDITADALSGAIP